MESIHPQPQQDTEPLRIGSLCSGYGGLELGLMAVVGGSVAWHVENDKHPSAVLEARFPGVPNYGDVTTTDWTQVEPVDWLTAGYPCQPDSLAGKGLSEDDHRWIWPAIAHAIGVLRPSHIFLENVPGHFVRGFRTVLGSLTSIRYDTQWTLVPATDVGAPHLRKRLFVVATDANRRGLRLQSVRQLGSSYQTVVGSDEPIRSPANTTGNGWHEGWPEPAGQLGRSDAAECGPSIADPSGRRREGRPERDREPVGPEFDGASRDDAGRLAENAWGAWGPAIRRWERASGRTAPDPTVSAHRGDGRRLSPRFVEWLMGLPDGWVTDVPGITRNEQLKMLGNGVVPQQAALAVRTLLDLEVAA